MVLVIFVSNLIGPVRKQTRYANPTSMHHALQSAMTVEQAGKQDRFNECFYTRFEKSVRLTSQSPSSTYAESSRTRHLANARGSSRTHVQQYKATNKASKDRVQSPRSVQIREVLNCYEWDGVGHLARECHPRLKREAQNPNSPRKRDQREGPSRPRFSGEKPLVLLGGKINGRPEFRERQRGVNEKALSASLSPKKLSVSLQLILHWSTALL